MPNIAIFGATGTLGGTETFIETTLACLPDNWRPIVFTSNNPVYSEKRLHELGASVTYIPARSRHPFKHTRSLFRLFREKEIDAVWLNATTLTDIMPLIAARFLRIPIRIAHSHSSSTLDRKLNHILHSFNRLIVPLFATHRFACSENAAEWFYKGRTATIVPNAFDVQAFQFSDKRYRAVRQKLNLKRKTILMVGQLLPVKNVGRAIDIFAAYTKDNQAELLVCGVGPEEEKIRQKIRNYSLQDKVHLLGRRTDIPDLMVASDLLLFPSLYEGFPYVLLEAQAASLHSIVSSAVTTDIKLTDTVHFADLNANDEQWAASMETWADAPRNMDVAPLFPYTFHAFSDFLDKLLNGSR